LTYKQTSPASAAQATFLVPLDGSYGKSTFTVDLKPVKDQKLHLPKPSSFTYDFTPRFLTNQLNLQIDTEGGGYLKITAAAAGIGIPVTTSKPWNFKKGAFADGRGGTLLSLRLDPDIQVLSHLKAGKAQPYLSSLVEFAFPAQKGCAGFCDKDGIFEARIPKIYLPQQDLSIVLEMTPSQHSQQPLKISGKFLAPSKTGATTTGGPL
jgi:hypothetical protein